MPYFGPLKLLISSEGKCTLLSRRFLRLSNPKTFPEMLLNMRGEPNGNFLRRADLYADAGNATKSEMERRQARLNQFTHEIRRLDPQAQHCKCCLAWADKWMPIGEMPGLGECDCNMKDRCTFFYGIEQEDGTIKEA